MTSLGKELKTMIKGYDKKFLIFVMDILGEAFAYSSDVYDLDMDVFLSYFISSGISKEYERGNPKYLYGQTGLELVHDVFGRLNIHKEIKPFQMNRNSIKQYWCGQILAYYQYKTSYSFAFIHSHISMMELLNMYNPLHEASEDRVVDEINNFLKSNTDSTKLQQRRKEAGLSQSQLADIADVSVRTLQEYEIGQKSINKASVTTVRSLASALNCNIEDILE